VAESQTCRKIFNDTRRNIGIQSSIPVSLLNHYNFSNVYFI